VDRANRQDAILLNGKREERFEAGATTLSRIAIDTASILK